MPDEPRRMPQDARPTRRIDARRTALNVELAAVIARHAPYPDAAPAADALAAVVQRQSFPRRQRGTK